MIYTAAEMREMADLLESKAEFEAAAMLRQAAEAMDANARLGWEGTLCPTCDTGGRCTYACGWHPPVAFAPATIKEGE